MKVAARMWSAMTWEAVRLAVSARWEGSIRACFQIASKIGRKRSIS